MILERPRKSIKEVAKIFFFSSSIRTLFNRLAPFLRIFEPPFRLITVEFFQKFYAKLQRLNSTVLNLIDIRTHRRGRGEIPCQIDCYIIQSV